MNNINGISASLNGYNYATGWSEEGRCYIGRCEELPHLTSGNKDDLIALGEIIFEVEEFVRNAKSRGSTKINNS